MTLYAGSLFVHYGQAYVESGVAHADDFGRAVAGQANGLLGAQVPGCLFLGTALHTGYVGFQVESHRQAPVVGDEWEDVVDACSTRSGPTSGWCSGADRPGVIDSYLLQFWPEQAARDDVVLRQGSAAAAYWHRVARADR